MEDITAEYASTDLIAPVELRALAKVSIGAKTDLGRVRENNEDKYEFFIPDDEQTLASKGQIFIVCDGMGGHAAGQIASELAAKAFIDVYLNLPTTDISTALSSSLDAANRYVHMISTTVPNRRGMGTTFTGLILLQEKGYAVQVGDSRCYRLREGELTRITSDHTYMEEMVKAGTLTWEQASVHPHKHVLTRAVGVEETTACDIYEFNLQENDVYFLCSDGILNHVSDEQIQDILVNNGPANAAWKLIRDALMGGGSDNATALIVRIDAIETFPSS